MDTALPTGLWIIGATNVLTVLFLILKLSGRSERRAIEPGARPVEVKAALDPAAREHEHSGYQTVNHCASMHAQIKSDMDRTEARHEARTEALRIEIKEDVKGVHGRIDDVMRGLSRIEGKLG
jgi:hypothetical protein